MNENMSSIRLENLTKRYGSVVAVDDVSLTIDPGSFVTLLGPSGSGKTTTMRMIAGLEMPTAGSVYFRDRMVSGPGVFVPTHRRRLGMVFQSYAVWPHKTVYQNVAFPLQEAKVSRGDQKARVGRMLERVGLADYGERYPSQLSGGQQQRVALARALVAEPHVILFDEPLSNLDAQLRESMRTLLQDIHRDFGITAVYVTHDQTEAMVLSDVVYVMHNGKLIQGGSPQDLYERPNSLFVAEFIGSANRLPVSDIDLAGGQVRLQTGEVITVASLPEAAPEKTLIVRPHQVRLAVNGEAVNVLEGVVGSWTYLGDRTRCVVRTDAGSDIELELPGRSTSCGEQQRVRLHVPPESCIVI
jgi:ABC-type Fe3+/spermidine/putrescine transport system ATPase subunit